MTDEQIRRLQRAAAEAAVRDGSNIVYLPWVPGESEGRQAERERTEPAAGLGPIQRDPDRGVFRRNIGPDLAIETDDTCAVCSKPSDEPVMCSDCSRVADTREAIEQALDWHREHPGSDYLDAAFAVAGRTGELGTSRWPQFVDAVRESVDAADLWHESEAREAER